MSGKRFATDYDAADVAFVFPELAGERLTRAIQGDTFPEADYADDAVQYWHEKTVLRYTNGRAAVETAAGENAVAVSFVKATSP